MRRLAVLVLLTVLLAVDATAQAPTRGQTAYVGGRWFDGERFAPRDTTWADSGVFVAARPAGRVRVVALGDAFVVPPFGDAHLHAFYDPRSISSQDSLLVARGVLSVLNPHVPATERESVRGIPTTVERAYAVAGIGAPGSHIATASEARALGLQAWDVWGPRGDEIRASRLRAGDAYYLAAGLDDLDAVWPRLLASRTDVVKVILNHSEDLGTDDARPSLSPEVLNEITRRARADGLRVVAHVETAADLAAALDAGVDALAHVPGYGVIDGDPRADPASPFVMSDALVSRLAASGIPVTPTLARGPLTVQYIPASSRPDSTTLANVHAFHRDLLHRLQTAGVALAVGADSGGLQAWDEAAYWIETGGLTAGETLRAWTETTPRMVFPERAVGALTPGAEASLLALACDPTADWSCTEQISHREHRGAALGATLRDAEVAARWRALDVPTFTAPETPADGALLRGLKATADGDHEAAAHWLHRALASVPDSLQAFVHYRLADVAAERFGWAENIRQRTAAGDDVSGSIEAGFARFPAASARFEDEEAAAFDGLRATVLVNGVEVQAVVDTGAPGTGIPRGLAERLGLRIDTTARGRSHVPSLGLEFEIHAALIDSVQVGGVTFYNVPASVGGAGAPEDDGEVFLGANLFRRFAGALRYGYADSTFTVVRDVAPSEAAPTFLITWGSAPVVRVAVGGASANAIIDTGNSASVYLARGVFEVPESTYARTASGTLASGYEWSHRLYALPFTIPGHPSRAHEAYEADYIFSRGNAVEVILGQPVWAGGTLWLDFVNRRVGWAPAGAQ